MQVFHIPSQDVHHINSWSWSYKGRVRTIRDFIFDKTINAFCFSGEPRTQTSFPIPPFLFVNFPLRSFCFLAVSQWHWRRCRRRSGSGRRRSCANNLISSRRWTHSLYASYDLHQMNSILFCMLWWIYICSSGICPLTVGLNSMHALKYHSSIWEVFILDMD